MTFATFHVTLPVPCFRKVRSDRDRSRGGKRISHFYLTTLYHITSPSPAVPVVVSLNPHYAPHTTAGCRCQGRVCQESTVEFIAGCDEEQEGSGRDGSWNLLFVWNSSQTVLHNYTCSHADSHAVSGLSFPGRTVQPRETETP
jgi:hypothetical protein